MLLWQGCEQDVHNLDDFKAASKLVVVSYISPQDDTLRVHLQKTQPAIGRQLAEGELRIVNATVTLSDGTTTVPLLYNAGKDSYEVAAHRLPVLANKTYLLHVSTPEGFTAEAACTVPSTAGITITDISYTQESSEATYYSGYNTHYTASFKWQDAPGISNYYRTLISGRVKVAHPDSVATLTLYFNDWNWQETLVKDSKQEGGILSSQDLHDYVYHGKTEKTKLAQLQALLVVADRHYYEYHRSIDGQEDADNPFAEPALIYTNIQGGLGVFAAYNQVEASKELN